MAIYSAGRRRTMLILVLTSILLVTLDLRGNALFDSARSGFEYAFRPFEIAGEVVTRPIVRVWEGMTQVDDLQDEVDRLQETIDQQRDTEIAGNNALIENQELRALLNLESLSTFDSVTASIIGSSPSNFDQRVEIDAGSLDGIRVGMPVVNSAGLVGKVTNVFPTTAIVMLVTDPLYAVPVKVVADVLAIDIPDDAPVDTVPSGLDEDDVPEGVLPTTSTTTSTTSTTTSTSTTTTTVPEAAGTTVPEVSPGAATSSSTTSTTTTTIPLVEITRETGVLEGLGADRLPRVRFVVDSSQFGLIEEGDAVLTAGGRQSLAPPNISVGKVANIIRNPGTRGLELEVELNADLERLNFLTVLLYLSPEEAATVQQ